MAGAILTALLTAAAFEGLSVAGDLIEKVVVDPDSLSEKEQAVASITDINRRTALTRLAGEGKTSEKANKILGDFADEAELLTGELTSPPVINSDLFIRSILGDEPVLDPVQVAKAVGKHPLDITFDMMPGMKGINPASAFQFGE